MTALIVDITNEQISKVFDVNRTLPHETVPMYNIFVAAQQSKKIWWIHKSTMKMYSIEPKFPEDYLTIDSETALTMFGFMQLVEVVDRDEFVDFMKNLGEPIDP